MYSRVLKSMSADVSEVRAASIISETSVDIDLRTRQYIREDSLNFTAFDSFDCVIGSLSVVIKMKRGRQTDKQASKQTNRALLLCVKTV
jgi:hypothetical protein